MKIIYVPGFGGKQNSVTFQNIQQHFPASKFVDYDNENAEIAFTQIQNQFQNCVENDSIIIGQSLGGFWAEIFAKKYNLNLILINPSLEPNISLKKYDISEKQLNLFNNYKSEKIEKTKITIILSKNDEVVNPEPVKQKYLNTAKFVFVGGGHTFRDYRVLFDEIEIMINDEN